MGFLIFSQNGIVPPWYINPELDQAAAGFQVFFIFP
jgi:hypothetical protein